MLWQQNSCSMAAKQLFKVTLQYVSDFQLRQTSAKEQYKCWKFAANREHLQR